MLAEASSKVLLEVVSLYLRHSSWWRGRERLERLADRLINRVTPIGRNRVVKTKDKFRIEVDVRQAVGRNLFAFGTWERATTRLFRAILRPGDTFVDVGAHMGYFSLLASRCVGPQGRVLSFEPEPSMRQRLIRNLELNGVTCCTVDPHALSDQPGQLTLKKPVGENDGLSTLRPYAGQAQEVVIPVETLDRVLPQDVKVHCVKIDTEGAEHHALKGMRGILSRDHPDVVVEITDKFLREMGSSAQALCDDMRSLGYRMYALLEGGLTPVPGSIEGLPWQYEALFTARTPPKTIRINPEWAGAAPSPPGDQKPQPVVSAA